MKKKKEKKKIKLTNISEDRKNKDKRKRRTAQPGIPATPQTDRQTIAIAWPCCNQETREQEDIVSRRTFVSFEEGNEANCIKEIFF